MKRLAMFFAFFLCLGLLTTIAQNVQISGTITSSEDGQPLPGASVMVKGTNIGTTTDMKGKYTLSVPSDSKTLVVSFIGLKGQEVEIGGRALIDVAMEPEATALDEVVVTALGISREKKSLGYSTQEIKGDQALAVKSDNFINSISGKAAGIQIIKNTNIGGSTNVIIRGNTSITGNNQALFVVDGVPLNNDITNTADQSQGGSGYDFGNAASDINPNDIESINLLKGAAATALYGSRASSGVVMITTKKGAQGKKGLGVSISSNITFGLIDKSTFPEYQKDYGSGYGMADWQTAEDGTPWVATMDDASNGPRASD